jgi:hypothetical protein
VAERVVEVAAAAPGQQVVRSDTVPDVRELGHDLVQVIDQQARMRLPGRPEVGLDAEVQLS